MDAWGDRHAIGDQLTRASGSIVENIAFASASFTGDKFRCMDYAIGSILECAACIDLALVKGLITPAQECCEKKYLFRLHNMMQALKRSWSDPSRVLKESGTEYIVGKEALFHHEKLDVYQVALALNKNINDSHEVHQMTRSKFRRVDEPATSIVLNIAEGVGGYSGAEKRRFFEVALESAVKLAARIDVCSVQKLVSVEKGCHWKSLIERITAMLTVMVDTPRRQNSLSGLTSVLTTDCSVEN